MPQGNSRHSTRQEIVIIGAGVVGLGIAWRLAQRGASVTLFDKDEAGAGASRAAAGMLAACAEAEPGEEELVELGRRSQALWPDFAAELEEISGEAIDLRTEGTLVVALTADDQARLVHHLAFQRTLGLPIEWLSAAQTRQREPHLAAGMAGAVFSPTDHQVDNRQLVVALLVAATQAGARLRQREAVSDILVEDERAVGVRLEDGSTVHADQVVLAAGAWSRDIEGIARAERPPVRPIKGQVIMLRMDPAAPILNHVLWAPGVYLVPRRDGRMLVGATVEEKGFDTTLTAGGVLSLLEAAWRVLPAIEELAIEETAIGFRPGSRDDAPILGPGPLAGLVYATGHHRNGILLAPITADSIAQLVLEGTIDPSIAAFGMGRFMPVAA